MWHRKKIGGDNAKTGSSKVPWVNLARYKEEH